MSKWFLPTKAGNIGGRYTEQFQKCAIWDARGHPRAELPKGVVCTGWRPGKASVLEHQHRLAGVEAIGLLWNVKDRPRSGPGRRPKSEGGFRGRGTMQEVWR